MENNEFQLVDTNTAMEKAETQKGMTEIQSQIAIAKSFPRDLNKAYTNLMKACSRKVLAEKAVYAYPRGGQSLSGPSIRLAEVALQCYGNVDSGIKEIEQRKGESVMQAYCYDLENNVKMSKTFTVKHEKKANNRIKMMDDPRDIYEHTANMGSRRMRSCILALIPADLIEAALIQCKKTVLGNTDEPIEDRIRKMVDAFDKLQVSQDMIEKRLNHPVSEMDMEELFEYRSIYESLRNSMAKREDFFEFAKVQAQEKAVEEIEDMLDDEAEELQIQRMDPALPTEIKELSDDEKKELGEKVKKEFGLKDEPAESSSNVENPEEKSEKKVEKAEDKPKKKADKKPAGNPID